MRRVQQKNIYKNLNITYKVWEFLIIIFIFFELTIVTWLTNELFLLHVICNQFRVQYINFIVSKR